MRSARRLARRAPLYARDPSIVDGHITNAVDLVGRIDDMTARIAELLPRVARPVDGK